MIRQTYDPIARALYLHVSTGAISKTTEVTPEMFVDFDGEGRVVGIELLNVDDEMQATAR